MGCDTAIHLAVTTMKLARAERRTAVACFVDLKTAFYSCVRSTFIPLDGPEAQEDFDYVLHSARVPEALRPLLTFVLSQPAALARLEDEPHLVAALIEAHRVAHFTVTGSPFAARSRRGTRPGNALADACFSLAFTQPLQTVAAYIEDRGLCLDTKPAVQVFRGAAAPASRCSSRSCCCGPCE